MTSKELSKEVQRKLKDAWLGIDYPESELINPLNSLPLDSDDFHLYLSYLMMQPEYFPLICKEILGVEVYPMQGLTLQYLWRHKFPLLIASRGFSKCCPLDTLIITNNGIEKIGNLIPEKIKHKQQLKNSDIQILGENGYHELDYSFYNGFTNTKTLTTYQKYKIEGTYDHPIRIVRNGKIQWEELQNINKNDRIIIDRNENWNYIDNNLDSDIAYMIGAIVGDGCYSIKSSAITFFNTDKECVDNIKLGLRRAFNCKIKSSMRKDNYYVSGGNKIKNSFIDRFGCNKYGGNINKSTPSIIWNAPKEAIYSYLRGLFDTDGTTDKIHGLVMLDTKVYELASDVQFLLNRCGIISRLDTRYNKKYKKNYYVIRISGSSLRVFRDKIGFSISRKMDILNYYCNKSSADKKDTIPSSLIINQINNLKQKFNLYTKQNRLLRTEYLLQRDCTYFKLNEFCKLVSKLDVESDKDYLYLLDILNKNYFYDTVTEIEDTYSETCDVHLKEDHSFISNGFISHNTFTVALYAILRALLIPDRKILIAGSVFRQSKMVFEYMEGIYNKSKILQSICHQYHKQPLSKGNDMHRFWVGNSQIMCVPIGTGESIRGLRANDLCVEEFAAHDRDVFETVLSGFVAVSSDPVAKMKQSAEIKMAKDLGLDLSEYKNSFIPENQMILSGTAYYQFNHFYEYWKKWTEIIESSNVKKIIDDEDKISDSLKPEDFCIVRIPVDLIPDGFMDKAQIARAQASLHSGNFDCEYNACLVDQNEFILTDLGYKKYKDINIGDKVLTHLGNFRKVTKKTQRPYVGNIFNIKTFGSNIKMSVTEDHPFFINNDFSSIDNKTKYLQMSKLSELNGLEFIDINDYVHSGVAYDKYIYTAYPNQQINQNQIDEIIRRYKTKRSMLGIGRDMNISYGKVWVTVKNNKRKTKSALNRYIKIDKSLGRIIGYYAAEGSVGSNGRNCCFSLGGHEPYYVNQLCKDIEKVFGIFPKVYYTKDNVASVTVNSRIFAELVKSICLGKNCYTKYINPDFLYSNEDFMLGFIEGIINGDGCIYKQDKSTIQLCSLPLISQLRVVLGYFDIFSTFLYKNNSGKFCTFRNTKYKNSDVYILNIYGLHHKTFMNRIFNLDVFPQYGSYTSVDSNWFNIRVKNIEKIEYSGLVYNLEVEDDHTYCLNNATCHNCFSSDSAGFYKRSLIESCVCGKRNSIKIDGNELIYYPSLNGEVGKRYVLGVDPASEQDNFAMVLLEVTKNYRKIVYCWTINRKEQKQRVKDGILEDNDFYYYCSLKIRELMSTFNIERIALDSQGGGIGVIEALSRTRDGEKPIYEVIDPKKFKESDAMPGLHIVEMINFASSDWTGEANHGMRKDFEHKQLLFPAFDSLSLGFAEEVDKQSARRYDTMEDCVVELEELKNELASIIIVKTATGRERWDTPETKVSGVQKRRMRKDRYSALLMANNTARNMEGLKAPERQSTLGGFAVKMKDKDGGPDFIGPDYLTNKYKNLYD